MSEGRINIAIDGLSACGKSTLARELASQLRYRHIDSGAMYRAVTLYFIKNQCDHRNDSEVAQALQDIHLDFLLQTNQSIITLNGFSPGDDLRTPAVDQLVSEVAAIALVREKVVIQQQLIGKQKGIVMDGRDIGSVVFPEAKLKLFLVADVETRVERRHEELKSRGVAVRLDEVRSNLNRRDQIDSTRQHSPLVKSVDAVTIDNTNLTRDEQLKMVLALAQHRIDSLSFTGK